MPPVRGVEGVRAAPVAPARIVQIHDQVDRFPALLLGIHPLELHTVVPVETLPFAMEVVSMFRAQVRQVGSQDIPAEG